MKIKKRDALAVSIMSGVLWLLVAGIAATYRAAVGAAVLPASLAALMFFGAYVGRKPR